MKLIAVGIGTDAKNYLQKVASASTCAHVFQLTDYMQLARAFPTELKMRLCEGLPPEASNSTNVNCTASGSLAFGRQLSLST